MSSTRPTVLLTLGRLPPAIDLARAYRAAGWRVIVADPFWLNMARTSLAVARVHKVTAPQRSPTQFLEDVAALVERYNVSQVIPVSEETPWVSRLKAHLAVPVFCGEPDQVIALHSKLRFIETAQRGDLAVPETYRLGTDRAAALSREDYVIKPEFSCSGRNVTLHSAGEPLPPDRIDLLVQRRLEGHEVSAFCVAQNGRCEILVTYRAHTRHGSVAVSFERIEQSSVRSWVTQFIRQTRYTGMLSFDFILDSEHGTARAIECNPRATSGIHFVTPQALVHAIQEDTQRTNTVYRDHRRMQEFWSHWTHWFSVIGRPEERRRVGRAIRSARDVTWSRRDPLVMPLATFSTWPIVWRAIRARKTFAEVLALDIEWRPE